MLVRNGDAHLKNFGLLYEHPDKFNSIRLSPLFDVVTTSIYKSNTYNGPMGDHTLALNLAGAKAYPTGDKLAEFGRKHCHVPNPEAVIERIADAMRETLRDNHSRFADVAQYGDMVRAWEAGLRVSGRPSTKASVITDVIAQAQEELSHTIDSFWSSDPLMEARLAQFKSKGFFPKDLWSDRVDCRNLRKSILHTAISDVIEMDRRVMKAQRRLQALGGGDGEGGQAVEETPRSSGHRPG